MYNSTHNWQTQSFGHIKHFLCHAYILHKWQKQIFKLCYVKRRHRLCHILLHTSWHVPHHWHVIKNGHKQGPYYPHHILMPHTHVTPHYWNRFQKWTKSIMCWIHMSHFHVTPLTFEMGHKMMPILCRTGHIVTQSCHSAYHLKVLKKCCLSSTICRSPITNIYKHA